MLYLCFVMFRGVKISRPKFWSSSRRFDLCLSLETKSFISVSGQNFGLCSSLKDLVSVSVLFLRLWSWSFCLVRRYWFCCYVLGWRFVLLDGDLPRSTRKSRSQSLSASFRNLFRRGKRSASGGVDVSRESSLSRSEAVAVAMPTLCGDSTATPSPQLSSSSWTPDVRHHATPEYTPRSYQAYATGGVGGGGTPALAARPSPSSRRWCCRHLLMLLFFHCNWRLTKNQDLSQWL